jgi:hypothetical protein
MVLLLYFVRFLIGTIAADILRRLNAQCVEEILSGPSVFDQYSKFSEYHRVETQQSSGSILESGFWDSEGVIHVDFIHVEWISAELRQLPSHWYASRNLGEKTMRMIKGHQHTAWECSSTCSLQATQPRQWTIYALPVTYHDNAINYYYYLFIWIANGFLSSGIGTISHNT